MEWDETVDVVAVGSGLAGLAAALAARESGLRTLVLEKGDKVGGSTTYSFGGVWVGNNPLARAEGYEDSRADTIAYMHGLSAGYAIEDNLLAFVDGAPVALEYFRALGIPFQLAHGIPDHYYPAVPGSKSGGRMLEAPLISGYELGDWRERVDVSPIVPTGVTFEEAIKWGGHGNYRNWDQALLAERRRQDLRGFGAGLAAHFLKALLARDVPVRLSAPAERLIADDGAVVGVVARQGDRTTRIQARRGVVLATSGYESNLDLVRRYEGFLEWGSSYPRTLTGDGLVMGAEIGAAVHVIPMNMGMFLGYNIPSERPGEPPTYRTAANKELSFPHTLVVNQQGRRFADESYFQAMLGAVRHFDVWRHRAANLPCYLIFDQSYADKYGFATFAAGSPIPDWVTRAETLHDLAAALEIDAAGLAATVARLNEYARTGEDADFQRGSAPWSNYYAGDLTNQPNPNLGPVERPPYYGVRLIPSGQSSAGLLTDRHGQVVHLRGHPIPGLYAAGNAAAYVDYGAGYQAGYSLARGMTFGYLAVQHLLQPR